MSPIHLRNAPILEAVVDIQGVTEAAGDAEKLLVKLRAAHDSLKEEFPDQEQRVERQIQVVGGGAASVNALVSGYQFRSRGTPQRVVQFRKNGYAFSWLKPYGTWRELIEGAERGWNVYRTAVPDFAINRIAVRFINQIRIPYPLQDSDQYLRRIPTPPTSPEEYPGIRSFVEQMVSTDATSGAMVGLVRLIEEPASGAAETRAMLDIDVFRNVDISANDAHQMWQILATFQDVKNRVFYKCIGPAIIEECGGEERA